MGTYVPKTVGDPNAIRRFADAKIEEAMRDQLEKLPKGKRGALVLYADQNAVKGAFYGRKPGKLFGILPAGEWTYIATAERTWSGELSGAAAVGYSW